MDSSRKNYYIPPLGLAHSYGRSGENGISSRDEYNPSPPTGYRRDNGFEGASASPYENMTTTFEPDPSYQDRESWNRYSFLAENDPRTQRTESQYPSHSFYNHRSSDTIAYTASSAIPRVFLYRISIIITPLTSFLDNQPPSLPHPPRHPLDHPFKRRRVHARQTRHRRRL